jgi:TM2 domain-containing membrane protein YozV
MSFDTFRDNNDGKTGGTNSEGQQSPYGTPQQPAAQQGNPYGYSAPQNTNPYSAPAQPQQAEHAGNFQIFGLSWQKNVIPNPATGGQPPLSQKSNVLAYVLWFFLGGLGIHQFYLGNNARGLLNLILGVGTAILGMTGLPFGIIYLAYWIYEAVTLNDQTIEINSGYIRKSIL